ncbi:MAG: fluoride efflux transporter CrcB [Saprospiraceae bacterium]|nr:fluoride efflux transporter CrcB [Saprospiraceae bacterium]
MNWILILSVALGAALGGVLRYLFSIWLKPEVSKFPWATLIVNLLGSFMLGLIISYFSKNEGSTTVKLMLTTGFCGGFTTFSAFSMELVLMVQKSEYLTAGVYIVASIIGGLGLAWLGYRMLI